MDPHNYSGRGYADDWNKTSYNESGGSNHVCRPVVVDAEGRKKPFLPFTPNLGSETYFQVSAQRTVEHVHTPIVVTEYKYSSQGLVEPYGYGKSYDEDGYNSPTKVEPMKRYSEYGYSSPPKRDPPRNYGALGFGPNDKWGGSTSPIQNRPPATEYGYGYPTPKGEYIKDSGVASDTNKWGPQVPGTDYGYRYPAPVKDPRVANDARECPPTRPNILSASAWRRPLGQGDATGNGDYNTSGDWNKPGGSSDYYRRNDKFSEPIMPKKEDSWERPGQTRLSKPVNDITKATEMLKEAVKSSPISAMPIVNTTSDWNKPSGNNYYLKNDKFPDTTAPFKESSWERPGQRLDHDTPLSGPTNDIEKAVEMLKEAVKTSAISAIPVVPRRDTNYANIIDSKEAATRYGNFNLHRPYQTEDTAYTGIIDSAKAKRMYGGAAIPK